MGARPQDYERSAPFHSFIHVDDFDGPEDLAKYLHVLDQDDQLYNEYFQWKVSAVLEFVCVVCAAAAGTERVRVIPVVNENPLTNVSPRSGSNFGQTLPLLFHLAMFDPI